MKFPRWRSRRIAEEAAEPTSRREAGVRCQGLQERVFVSKSIATIPQSVAIPQAPVFRLEVI